MTVQKIKKPASGNWWAHLTIKPYPMKIQDEYNRQRFKHNMLLRLVDAG